MSNEPSRLSRALAYTLVVALASAGAPLRSFAQGGAAPAQAGSAASPDPELRRLSAKLARAAALTREELARPGACPWDVHAKAVALGFDPARIFAFVQREVRFEPYAGVLRGAKGALAGRAANATDKALLLAALLDASGHRTRLVQGALPPEKARALVQGFLAADPLAGTLGEMGFAPPTVGDLAPHAAALGLDARDLAAEAARGARAADALLTDADAAARRETDALLKSLVQAKVKRGRGFDAWMSLLAERAARHVWVEMRDAASEEERWVALDPTTPGAQAGAAPLPEGEVVDAGALERHAVALQLVLTRGLTTGDGAEREEEVPLLEAPLAPSDAIAEHATLSITPAEGVPSAAELMNMSGPERVKVLSGLKRFQPVLRVGPRNHAGRPFDLGGGVFDVTAGGGMKEADMGAAVAGAALGFDRILGGEEGPAKASDARPVKARLLRLEARFTFESPGAEPRTQRRTLLAAADLSGEHVLSPMLSWQLLLETQPTPRSVAERHALRADADGAEALLSAMDIGGPEALDQIVRRAPEPFAAIPLELAALRGAAIAARLGGARGLTVLWDAPNLALLERRSCMRPTSGHACGRARIDIVENAIAFVPKDAARAAAAFEATLAQGVFDTAAEALLLQRRAPLARTHSSPIAGFERARIAGTPLAAGLAGDDAPPTPVIASADWAHIRASERSDRRILAPAQGAPGGGWWSLDAETGAVIGRGSGGAGTAGVEYADQVLLVVGEIGCVLAIFVDVAFNVARGKTNANSTTKWFTQAAGCAVGFLGGYAGAAYTAQKITFGVASVLFATLNAALGSHLDTSAP